MDKDKDKVPEENIFKKLWTHRKYFYIEIIMFFYFMPAILTYVAQENVSLEKACRVNFNYSSIVCTTILDKATFGIDCNRNDTDDGSDMDSDVDSGLLSNVTDLSLDLNVTVCKAEKDAQKLSAKVTGYRSVIGSFLALFTVLFAGSWGDRHNKRKACLLIPIFGEILSGLCLMITAIYFDEIPMEFGDYATGIIPQMFGGPNLVLVAVYSLLTIKTPESDRVFRFGIFSMVLKTYGLLGTPFSGVLFKKLGYVYSFVLNLTSFVIAFICVIFLVDETKPIPPNEDVKEGKPPVSENPETNKTGKVVAVLEIADPDLRKNKSCLADFFDPTLALECVQLPLKKRKNYEQTLLIALMFSYFFMSAVVPEVDYTYKFVLAQLNWNGNKFSAYNEFAVVTEFLGTFIGTAILSKILKLSDPMLGFLGALSMAIARPFYALAPDSKTYYVGSVADMFKSLRTIATRAIASSIVEEGELGRMFACFSVVEPIAEIIFSPLYSYVYSETVKTFPGAFFLITDMLLIPNIIIFMICYILLKKRARRMEAIEADTLKDKTEQANDQEIEDSRL